MAAWSNAAAAPGPKDGAFMSFNVVCSSQNIVDLSQIHKQFSPEHIYDRQSLLDIGNAYKHQLSPEAAEKLQGLCLLRKPNLETAGESPSCLTCQTKMTVKHILLDCTVFNVNRQQFYSEVCSTDLFKNASPECIL